MCMPKQPGFHNQILLKVKIALEREVLGNICAIQIYLLTCRKYSSDRELRTAGRSPLSGIASCYQTNR